MQKYEKQLQILKGVLITVLVLVGANYAVAEWSDPTGTPPNNNAPAPINVSSVSQTKTGALITGGVRALTDVIADERFQLKAGAGAGKVLTSDSSGFGTWQTGGGGGGSVSLGVQEGTITTNTQTGTGYSGSVNTGISSTQYSNATASLRGASQYDGDRRFNLSVNGSSGSWIVTAGPKAQKGDIIYYSFLYW